jgi:predicted ArsR family transcriptional regulator
MYSIQYRQTNQGKQTRSQLIDTIRQYAGLTRNELVDVSGLTYEQVRRQTRNLSIEGIVQSRIEAGQRRYYLR